MAGISSNIKFGTFVPAVNRSLQGFDYANHGKWKEPFYFVQITDIQYGMIGSMNGERGWSQEIKNADMAVKAINKMFPRPKFVIVTGDLVHALPGEREKEDQEKDFKRCFSKLDPAIPLFCIPGNHDIGNTPTPETIDYFKANFGDDYFSFWVDGVKFIAPNLQYMKDAREAPSLKEDHDKWLEEELAGRKKSKHTIFLQHIPWFLQSPDEPDDRYFNIPTEERTKWLPLLKTAGVEYAFAGHYHRNSGGQDQGLEMTVTSALGAGLGNDKSGFRLIKVQADKVTHKYFACDDRDIPRQIDSSVSF